jgi:hypothetical protein
LKCKANQKILTGTCAVKPFFAPSTGSAAILASKLAVQINQQQGNKQHELFALFPVAVKKTA